MVAEVSVTGFSGINNTATPERLQLSGVAELAAAINVDITDTGAVARRKGLGHAIAAGPVHSLFEHQGRLYFFGASGLNELDVASGLVTPVPDCIMRATVSVASVGNVAYLSDGVSCRKLSDGIAMQWGIDPPAAPSVSATQGGGLLAGHYMIACTFVRADGEESGASPVVSVSVSNDGSVQVGLPTSSNPDITDVALYCSGAGGQTLRLSCQVSNGTDTVTVSCDPAGPMLRMIGIRPPLAASSVRHWNGRMFIAHGNHMLFSRPFQPEQFDPARQFITFDSPVTMIDAPDSSALFVGTSADVFRLSGGDIDAAALDRIADYGAVPGTSCPFSAEVLPGAGSSGNAVFFASTRGPRVIVGGNIIDPTGGKYAFGTEFSGGTSAVTHDPASRQRVVCALTA